MMTHAFEPFGLHPQLIQAVTTLGYTTPTPIQQQAIPVVLQGHDVLGTAQTGTGKTAAFMLPILERLTKGSLGRVRVLVLAPTRELAEQIHQATVDFSKHMKVRSVAIYGGVSKGPQIEALRRGAEIVVACPGRLLDLMGEGRIDLSHVEVFVLDEADRMCDMGFLPDVRRIVKQLPERRQSLFFSATMPRDARQLANTILRDPVTIKVGMAAPVKTVSHALYPTQQGLKKKLLLALLDQTATGRVLIFTRTKYRARNLARDLDQKGFRVAALQGNMSQNQRQRAMDGFRQGKLDLLVATDIAARGIDVTEITHVINFDMPDTVDAYTHRIGRTGRAQETGEAFTFATQEDEPMVRSIEQLLGYRIKRRELHGFEHGEFEVVSPQGSTGSNSGPRRAAAPNQKRNPQHARSKRRWRSSGRGNGRSQGR
jgi:ATP-dependent RNA helicase RhlE